MLVNISMEDNNNNAKEELYLASYIVENPMLVCTKIVEKLFILFC